MAFDAFCYMAAPLKEAKKEVIGETQDKTYAKFGAFEILNFEIGAENTLNIGSGSSGAGAGKASFKELSVSKKTDTASCELFAKLCDGTHFDDMTIDLRRSSGSGKSGLVFLRFSFKLVAIQDITWSGADGDDVCEETVIMQYGAMKVWYTAQKATGEGGDKTNAEWSRVLNEANFAV